MAEYILAAGLYDLDEAVRDVAKKLGNCEITSFHYCSAVLILKLTRHPFIIGLDKIERYADRLSAKKYLLTWLALENKMPLVLVSKIEREVKIKGIKV